MSEDTILGSLFARMPAMPEAVVLGPGDDCAALETGSGRLLLVAVDQVVGERHYALRGTHAATPRQVGRKLLARNLSDIAAMGGRPTSCVVALATPERRDTAWLQGVFDGILALAGEYGVAMVGGDLARTPADEVGSLTILGEVQADRICRRAGARPGDALYVTGRFGSSFETGHHLDFQPRCAEGAWLAEAGWVQAMMDVSDGLVLDATRLCRASRVDLALEAGLVPRRCPETTLEQALTQGEDYELMLAVDPARENELRASWPFREVPLTRVGQFAVAMGEPRVRLPAQVDLSAAGFDHFS